MIPEPNQPPGANPITIDLGLNSLIQRVDTNVRQQIIITTADKARLCLMQALDRMEQRRAWMAPAGILATLVVIFPTTTFNDFLGLSKEYWRALFTIAAICTTVWLIRALLRIRVSLSVDDIVDRLRTESLALSSEEPQTFDKKLVIVKALYGHLDTRVDVTSQMNSAIRDGKLRLHVGNQLSGDPCRSLPRHSQGCRSDLSIWARGTDPNFS
jgi:hypothetical protein